MPGWIDAISNALGFGKAVVEKSIQHEKLENAPDKQAAAEAAKKQEVVDRVTKEVASNDLDAIRKEVAAGTGPSAPV